MFSKEENLQKALDMSIETPQNEEKKNQGN